MAEQAMAVADLDTDSEDLATQAERVAYQSIHLTEEQEKELSRSADSQMTELENTAKTTDFSALREKYSNFGKADLDKYDTKFDSKDINIKLGELDDDTNQNVSDNLGKLYKSLKGLSKQNLKIPGNRFLRKIFDPISAFRRKALKASTVVEECSSALKKQSQNLVLNKEKYKKEIAKHKEAAEAAQKQQILGTELIERMKAKIEQMEADPNVPDDVVQSWKSEVLAPLEQRVMDISQIVVAHLKLIISLDIVLRTTDKMISEVERTEEVAIVQFNTAIEIANGIHVQEQARKTSNMVRDTAAQLDKTNAISLQNSAKSIEESTQQAVMNVQMTKESLATLMDTAKSMKDADAHASEVMATSLHEAQSVLGQMWNSIDEYNQLSGHKEAILDDGNGIKPEAEQFLKSTDKNATPEADKDEDAEEA